MSTSERLVGQHKFSWKKLQVEWQSSSQHPGAMDFPAPWLKSSFCHKRELCVSINTHRIGIFPLLPSPSLYDLTNPQNLSWYNNICCCQLFNRHRFIPWVLNSWNFVLSHWLCGSSGCTRWELYFYRHHIFYIDAKYGTTESCYAA